MGMEIERKFRLDSAECLLRLMEEGLRVHEAMLCQVYTRMDKEAHERYRFDGTCVVKTCKRGKGLVREEWEEEVSYEAFEEALEVALGRPVIKKRCTFKLQEYAACVDIFEKELAGLVVLEVEFESVEAAQQFSLPPFLQEVAVEVTEDERYKNHALALHGLPSETVDVEALLLHASRGEMDVTQLRAVMPSYDALRVIFAHLYAKIIFHKDAYVQEKANEHLHQFRVNIRKTRSLLQSLPQLFDEGIADRFIKGFKVLASQTNAKRDLDVFGEYLDTCTPCGAIALHVAKSRENEDEKISLALTDQSCVALLQEWRMVLEDEEGFFRGKSSGLAYRAMGAMALKTRMETLALKMKKLNETKPLELFHRVRIEFKRLRYLLEYFEPHFASKPMKEAIKKAKAMQETFGLLQDRDVQLGVLDALEHHPSFCEDVESVAALEKLRESLRYEIYALRLRILSKKKALVRDLRACTPLLERYLANL